MFWSLMSQLTEQDKQNGKRKVLIPSQEIQDLMQPITREEFTALVKRAIPPSQEPDPAAK